MIGKAFCLDLLHIHYCYVMDIHACYRYFQSGRRILKLEKNYQKISNLHPGQIILNGYITIHDIISEFLISDYTTLVYKVSLSNRNVNPIIFGIWDWENSLFITQGTFKFPCLSQIFPIHGLAVVVNKKSTIRGFAAHGGFFIHHAC